MSSVDEYDAYDFSLDFDNNAPTTPSGPPNPYKTPDRSRPIGCPTRQKNVRTKGQLSPTDKTAVSRPICIPVKHTVNGSHNDTENAIAELRYPQLSREAKGWIVGPMPEEPFLNRYLPYNTENDSAPGTPTRIPTQYILDHGSTSNASPDESVPVEASTGGGFSSMQFPAQSKKNMYEDLCKGLNEACDGHFFFVPTSAHLDLVSRVKPDICLYRDDVIKRFERTDETTGKTYYLPDLASCDLFCELKKNEKDDPCDDAAESGKAECPPGPSLEKGKSVGKPKTFIRMCDVTTQKLLDYTFGQFTAYAMAVLSRQYRTHCFCIGVFGPKARFFRWDRAGVVISRAFNYKEKPWLTEFAKRYCQATDAQRGYDISVCKATEYEEEIFEEKIREHVIDLYAPKDKDAIDEFMKRHYQEDKVFKIKVWPQNPKKLVIPHDKPVPKAPEEEEEDEESSLLVRKANVEGNAEFDDVEEAKIALESIEQTQVAGELTTTKKERKSVCRKYVEARQYQFFLVSRPVAVAISIAGRSTRGYWAVKIPDENAGEGPDDYRICFLKDTWRMDMKGTGWEAEGDVVVALYEAGVSSVSDIFCHSDVSFSEDEKLGESNHETVTNKCVKEEWNCNEPNYTSGKHTHYRMVSMEVGCPLRELLGAFELLEATRMAFTAILQALVKCGRLHGDISINNILITRKKGEFVAGILIDWEFSCILNGEEGRRYRRSGTWAYMSINILRNPTTHIRGLRDDMESLYYVVSHCGIRWLPHNEVENLSEHVHKYFFSHDQIGVDATGGDAKIGNVVDGKFTKEFKWGDKATKRWMADAWALQKLQIKGGDTWKPKDFMKVWTDALALNPSKVDRVEHEIKFRGRNISSTIFAATASLPVVSCSVSHISQKFHVSPKFSNPRSSSSLKRCLEETQREGTEPIIAKDGANKDRMDNMLPVSKKSRLAAPQLNAESTVFLEQS